MRMVDCVNQIFLISFDILFSRTALGPFLKHHPLRLFDTFGITKRKNNARPFSLRLSAVEESNHASPIERTGNIGRSGRKGRRTGCHPSKGKSEN
ncbi:hypothetical protein AKJ57_01425 [candidate division MSBL1 archaeon SCGC-AAA259A05]|uniref:Uncharacterized protein n=1 Tax=candidate division MSBL1 archaeon SCGC-AAA259A05 TaxID=1698259 RepID=A0A133UB46_9EURY|nr:hypothetical protein AKJ57_01425 [candidate division MSBL1 archaeon SCGC-AAA259A05]